MKITDLQVIPFRVPRRPYRNGQFLPETTVIQTLTKIVTDAGAEGYYLGGHGHGDQDGLHPDEIAALQRPLPGDARRAGPVRPRAVLALDVGRQPAGEPDQRRGHGVVGSAGPAVRGPGAQAAGRLPRPGQGVCQHLPEHGPARGLRGARAGVQGAGLPALQDPPLLLLGSADRAARSRPAVAHRAGHRGVPGGARRRRAGDGALLRPVGHLPDV